MAAKCKLGRSPADAGSGHSAEPGPISVVPAETASVPNAYEAMVYSTYLPNRTVAFIFPESGIPFCAGIFRIEYLRPVTEADEAAFPSPNADTDDEICPLCDRVERFA